MNFRSGLIIGAALGYYYGSKAGRERYEQIDAALARVRSQPVYQRARGQVLGSVVDVREAAKDRAGRAVSSILPNEAEPSFEPGLEFNPDFTPTPEEILADLRGEAPSA